MLPAVVSTDGAPPARFADVIRQAGRMLVAGAAAVAVTQEAHTVHEQKMLRNGAIRQKGRRSRVGMLCWVLAGTAGCVHAQEGEGKTQADAAASILELPGGPQIVSATDMADIKQALIAALQERAKQAPSEFEPLLAQLEAAPVRFTDSVAHIGPWRLEVQDDEPVLMRTSPASPMRLIYMAHLQHQGRVWRVQRIDVRTIRAR